MEVIFGVIAVGVVLFFLVVAAGNAKGPPNTTEMTIEQILARIQSEEAWIKKFHKLELRDIKPDIFKMYEQKKLYICILQMTIACKAEGKDLNQTLIPIMNRTLELMRSGMEQKEAQTKASEEFVEKRDSQNKGPI